MQRIKRSQGVLGTRCSQHSTLARQFNAGVGEPDICMRAKLKGVANYGRVTLFGLAQFGHGCLRLLVVRFVGEYCFCKCFVARVVLVR